jgi:hypothetical protein
MNEGKFPLDENLLAYCEDYFRRKKIAFREDDLLAASSSTSTTLATHAVIGLRAVGTKACVPSLKPLAQSRKRDLRDCTIYTVAHLAGSDETPWFAEILGSTGWPTMAAIRAAADDRAVPSACACILKWLARPGIAQ